MRPLALAFAAFTAFTLSGCYTADHPKLSAQVGQRATAGLPISTAIAHLTEDGFTCHADGNADGASPNIECSRTRHGAILYTCIERATLAVDTTTRKVASLKVAPIACAGL